MRNTFPQLFGRSFRFISIISFLCLLCVSGRSQSDGTNVRFTQGQTNESGVSLSVPITTFPGRGLDLPVGLTYSSSVWRIDHMKSVKNFLAAPPHYVSQSVTRAIYAEHSTAGWKSSLDLPRIEWPKHDEIYSYKGAPATCCWNYRIARVTIHMPDGSTHQLRKSDRFYQGPYVDTSGTFYAVDGSRIRFDSTGVDTGTLFLPDGTRYDLGHPLSHITDRHGNRQTYNEATRQWTDTLGRLIGNPIPANPQPQDYSYSIPGLEGSVRTYVLKWRRLADALAYDGTTAPSLRPVASHYLPYPSSPPTDSNSSNFPQPQTGTEFLFRSIIVPPEDETNLPPYPVPVLVVGNGEPSGQVFDPVVLTEIVLPDGSGYKFGYNVYGELSKVVYPTGAFELYEYDPMISDPDQQRQPYVQATRKLSSKRLSTNGTGSDFVQWQFSQAYSPFGYRKTLVVAPDNTRTETFKWDLPEPLDSAGKRYWPFGQSPSRNGMVFETRAYSAPAGGSGELLRRELTSYEESVYTYTYTAAGINPPFIKTVSAYRNARPAKSVSVLFEGSGPALARAQTYGYDTTHQFTTGVDQTTALSYHYAVVDNTPRDEWGSTLAKNGTIDEMPLGQIARTSETFYKGDAVYRDQNILGLVATARLRDAAGNIVSQSEIVYDECPQYCDVGNQALPTSMRAWDSSKGAADNAAAYLVTHAKFDQYGNQTEATDAKGFVTTTIYDSTYQTYPISVISPAPDPLGGNGSQDRFATSTAYDTVTGLPITTADLNGQVTTIEYNDPLLRPTRVIAPNGHQTITEYGAGTSEATRWIKVRTQIDTEKWSEAISRFDGLGRTYLNEKIDSNGNIFTETEYDILGRVKRSTNPFKAGEAKQWTMSEYDDLSRVRKVVSPDTDDVGISYGLSTSGAIGTTKTIVDQAGRQRTGISDALGNMVRIYEGPISQNLFTDYLFDSLGSLRRTIQGEQQRYFMCDSLGRVMFARHPEQDPNPALVAVDPITANSSWSIRYMYDDNGNIRTTIDARNISVTGTYDRLNRLVTRDYSDTTPDVTFYYDGTGLTSSPAYSKGKTTRVTSSVSETRNISFDIMGRLLASEQRTTPEQRAGTQAPYGFKYVYNLSGSLIEETYPSGRVIKNTVNIDGELSQVQSKKNSTHGFFTYADAFEYNSAGAMVRTQLGNGHWETAEYDPKRLQITRLGLGITATDQNLLRLEFQYNSDGQVDNNGSMRLQRVSIPAAGGRPETTFTQSYFYDSLNRLTSAVETVSGSQTWKQTFSYDRYGNRRLDPLGTTTLGSCQSSICNPNISTANNRFLGAEGYAYDPNGSLVSEAGGSRFVYDADGRQKEFFLPANQTSSPDATYHYDGEGRRVKKVVGTETTVFVYNAAGKLAAEYSTNVVAASQAMVGYLTADHLGSPRIITDQYGRVASRKDFSAFGEEIVTPQRAGGPNGNGYDPPGVRQDYTGYEKDDESGLEFAQARYYNPRHGRFTSVDPLTASATIRNPQTFNRYSYVINSPYKFVDPLGLALADIGVQQTRDPYLARYLENNSTYQLQKTIRASDPQGQSQTQGDVALPQVLSAAASLNPRQVTSTETGEYLGITTLTDKEVESRVRLTSMAYNAAFREGVREVQRENGENIDVTGVQSGEGSQSGNGSQTTAGGSLSVGTNAVSGTVSGSESNSSSNSRTGSFTTTATVTAGVALAAADSARLAAARQEVINSELGVLRDVVRSGRTTQMRVDPTRAIDGFIKHAVTLGRIDGRLSYGRTRILQ